MRSLGLSVASVAELVKMVVPAYFRIDKGRLDPDEAESTLRTWAKNTVARARIQVETQVSPDINPKSSYVLMYNHQSLLDIPIVYATSPLGKIRMVAKTELFKIPIWGKALRAAGMIEVDRKNRDQAIESLSNAAAEMRRGTSVIIAPEGSRSADGRVQPLKKGGFHLAKQAGVPIIPIAISGAFRVLSANQTRMRYDVPVKVAYGSPIATDPKSVDELIVCVEHYFAEHVDLSMNSEA